MASGRVTESTVVQFAGSAARMSNRAAQLFTPFKEVHREDVGHVVADVYRAAWLWVGGGSAQTLNGIETDEAAEGIVWDSAVPQTVRVGESMRIIFTVTPEGPLEFEAALGFLSACLSPAAEIVFVGTRAPQVDESIFFAGMRHNWEEGWTERIEWLTDIMKARDGSEQRVRLRQRARRSFSPRFLVSGIERRSFEAALSQRRSRGFILPIWRDVHPLTEGIEAGASVIPFDEGSDNLVVGSMVALMGAGKREIRDIDGLGSGFISVSSPFELEWPEGALIAPVRVCVALPGSGSRIASRFTEDVTEYRLELLAKDDIWAPLAPGPERYYELPVCPLVPSWIADAETEIDNGWHTLDNSTGVIEFVIPATEPLFRRSVAWTAMGKNQVNTLLAHLTACAGRLAPFWLSQEDRGFEPAEPLIGGSNSLVAENIGYIREWLSSPARSNIELRHVDGRVLRARITGAELQPDGTEKLLLASPIAAEWDGVGAADLARCAWLELVRLDSDSIELKWFTGECVEVKVPVVNIQEIP